MTRRVVIQEPEEAPRAAALIDVVDSLSRLPAEPARADDDQIPATTGREAVSRHCPYSFRPGVANQRVSGVLAAETSNRRHRSGRPVVTR